MGKALPQLVAKRDKLGGRRRQGIGIQAGQGDLPIPEIA
jgi:hypothetical protein